LIKTDDEYKKITNMMESSYKLLKNVYKYFSSVSIASDIWGISVNTWTDLANQCDLFDKNFNLAASDLQFGTTNYKGDRKDAYNPAAS